MTNDIRYGGLLGLPRQTSPDGTGGILGQFFAQPAEEPGINPWPIHAGGAWPLPPGFYLSPVPRAPSWEQIVPTGIPWSVTPKLPSATAWGDTIAGHECHAFAGNLDCITPGARRFPVPAKHFPDGLRIAPGEPHYHSYNKPDGPVALDAATLMQGVIDRPTVGPVGLVRPATPEGTLNEATPATLYHILRAIAALKAPLEEPPTYFNPVKSYLTTDQNGTPMVVNVTEPEHGLIPGLVNRYVTTSPSGSTIQNEGTGLGLLQGPSKLGYFRDWIGPPPEKWSDLKYVF